MLRRCVAHLWMALLCCFFAASAAAEPAVLVADEVFVEAETQLIATGNVEVFAEGRALRAAKVTYNQKSDTLILEGPLRITEPDGTVFTAEEAELDPEFRNGILQGARMVMNDHVQMAAQEAQRVDGRYTQLSRVAATSCLVCGKQKLPLWQIRAVRVVHDQQARQIYFEKAQFRILDTPVFYLPRLRMPDPTLKRARGFLTPSLHASSTLGFGMKFPYFIPIGDHQDLTLTPFLSENARTLEWRYRRAFSNGRLTLLGSASRDTLVPDETRTYLRAVGRFQLPNDFTLQFDGTLVSEDTYLANYDITSKARIRNDIGVQRTRRDSLIEAELIHWNSLRVSGAEDYQPNIAAGGRIDRRFFPAYLGGEFRLMGESRAHLRYGRSGTDSGDQGPEPDGRDMARINVEASWRDRWTLPLGIRAGASTHLWLDHFESRDDDTNVASASYATPGVTAELRWPFMRRGAAGGRTLIEPLVQLGWTGGDAPRHGNDESLRPDFDEGNLLSLSHFPGQDRRDRGTQLAAGLRFSHQAAAGWQAHFTMGKLWQDQADPDFTRASGLSTDASDLILAGQFKHETGLTLTARGLLSSDYQFTRGEVVGDWRRDRINISASYLLLRDDPQELRDSTIADWKLATSYRMGRHWTANGSASYDLSGDRLDRVGLGLQYKNECIQFDVGANRNFGSSGATPTTQYDLTVDLLGFGGSGNDKEYHRTCKL